MPNGINLTKFSSNDSDYAEIREELEYADEFIWLAVGRFVPEKDYLNMVTAFSEIRMEFGSCKSLIAARGRSGLRSNPCASSSKSRSMCVF